jgi:hypothetical protein
MGAPTEGDVIRAIDKMVRMKAMDTRPDDKGHRRIWHHSEVGGELISIVDDQGRVLQQELTLFEDFVLWHHGTRIRTGSMPPRADKLGPPDGALAKFDSTPSRERIDRLRKAFEGYGGSDNYLIHIKHLIEASRSSGFPAAAVVTRHASQLYGKRRGGGAPPLWVIALAAVAILGVVLLLLARRG